jgi:hypothetical protein
MRIPQFIRSLFTAAVIGACAYFALKWHGSTSQDNEVTSYAKTACVDEIGNRLDVSNIRPYEVRESHDGYVVRASVTLAKGKPAKVICLTNSHGGVKDISITEY